MKKFNIEAIAKGEQEVDTGELHPIQAIQLGLNVENYRDEHGLHSEESPVDYEAVANKLKDI